MPHADEQRILNSSAIWPSLPFAAWQDTYATLHMWTQIVGKIRLVCSPPENHWWHVTFYVTSRGLTTSPMPYGSRTCTIDFDFIEPRLLITTSAGMTNTMALAPRSVADFYQELMAILRTLGIEVVIRATPDEVENPIPFVQSSRLFRVQKGRGGRRPSLLPCPARLCEILRLLRLLRLSDRIKW